MKDRPLRNYYYSKPRPDIANAWFGLRLKNLYTFLLIEKDEGFDQSLIRRLNWVSADHRPEKVHFPNPLWP